MSSSWIPKSTVVSAVLYAFSEQLLQHSRYIVRIVITATQPSLPVSIFIVKEGETSPICCYYVGRVDPTESVLGKMWFQSIHINNNLMRYEEDSGVLGDQHLQQKAVEILCDKHP